MSVTPIAPDYEDRSIVNVLGAVTGGGPRHQLKDLREALKDAETIVLVLLVGLGELQLADRAELAPWLASHRLAPITSVAPSTTAAALTSITTEVPPGTHGLVGYRFTLGEDVLQSLRWTVDGKDAVASHTPDSVQHVEPRLVLDARPIPYVGRSDYVNSAFTRSHLRGCDYRGADGPDEWIEQICLASTQHRVVLAYFDVIDKTAHAEGLGAEYDRVLSESDQMIATLRSKLPESVAIVVTADHGQIDVGSDAVSPSASTLALVERMSGEGRFRWLHAYPGLAGELRQRAEADLSDSCWIRSRREVCDEGWLGDVDDEFVDRLGDVAVIPFAPVFVPDPAEPRESGMKGRHGSLTPEEMWVPLIVG